MEKVNQHIKKLAHNQGIMLSKLQKLDKIVKVLLNSYLSVNENMTKISTDIELLKQLKNDNIIAINELD